MMEFLGAASGLKPLGIVYGVLAVGYVVSRLAFRILETHQTYIVSDSKGHKVKITLDSRAPAEERARVMNEKVSALAAHTA